MTKGTLYFIVLCFFFASCHAQEACQKSLHLDVKEDFKDYLLTQYDDIKISGIYSNNSNKKGYLQKSLGDLLLKEVIDIKAHDIYFKKLSEKSESHLGVAYLHYGTVDKAKKAISSTEKQGFFENTKILTQYVAINGGVVNIIVYTESAANKTALDYLDAVAKSLAQGKF